MHRTPRSRRGFRSGVIGAGSVIRDVRRKWVASREHQRTFGLERMLGYSLALACLRALHARCLHRRGQHLAEPMGSSVLRRLLRLFPRLVARGRHVCAVAVGGLGLSALPSLPLLRVTSFALMTLPSGTPNQSRQPTPGGHLGRDRTPVARRGCALR